LDKATLWTFSASKGPHFIPGALLSVTDRDVLYQDVIKGHVMNVLWLYAVDLAYQNVIRVQYT
jgi:hypothetical protein